jgi:hypothetical protein
MISEEVEVFKYYLEELISCKKKLKALLQSEEDGIKIKDLEELLKIIKERRK